jgi:hypothetical protein
MHKQFALRWRTESEVISGAGETTCGNTRCSLHHHHGRHHADEDGEEEQRRRTMKTLELPFAYVERGEDKRALVKVVLCDRCVGKLMWKRNKEKEKAREKERLGERVAHKEGEEADVRVKEEVSLLSVCLQCRLAGLTWLWGYRQRRSRRYPLVGTTIVDTAMRSCLRGSGQRGRGRPRGGTNVAEKDVGDRLDFPFILEPRLYTDASFLSETVSARSSLYLSITTQIPGAAQCPDSMGHTFQIH